MGKYKCENCERTYGTVRARAKHMKDCNNSDVHKCEVGGCEKLFSSRSNLKKHQLIHNGEKKETKEKRIWICQNVGCMKKYSSSSSRAVHAKKCGKPKGSPQKKAKKLVDGFKCRYCPRVFDCNSSVYRHQKENCNAARILQGKHPVFKRKKKEPYRFNCKICHHAFDRKGKLDKHKKMHSEIPSYQCCKCGRAFSRSDHHAKHESKCGENGFESVEFVGNSFCQNEQSRFIDGYIDSDDGTPSENVDFECCSSIPNSFVAPKSCFVDVSFSAAQDVNLEYPEEQPVFILPDDFDMLESEILFNNESETQNSEEIVSESDDDANVNSDLLLQGVFDYLRSIKGNSDKLYSYLYQFLGNNIHNTKIQKWLYKSLGIKKCRFVKRLDDWLSPQVERKKKGRPFLDSLTRQQLFDLWIEKSIVSVDRRNGRDVAKLSKYKYDKQYKEINCDMVTFELNKRNTLIAKATRYISTVTVRKMVDLFKSKFGKDVSIGTALNLRPFFVGVPSEREKIECMCKICYNARLLFNCLMKSVSKLGLGEVYKSLTEYLVGGVKCQSALNGYISLQCLQNVKTKKKKKKKKKVNDNCKECIGNLKPHEYDIPEEELVTFYQFELVKTGYMKKNGKEATRTARVDYSLVPLTLCKSMLDKMAVMYLFHRYDVESDKQFWKPTLKKITESGQPVVHIDYSENLKEKSKMEVQDAHFSGQEHSLHSLHFSDIRHHNWKFTACVLLDLNELYFKHSNKIVIKSDNCPVQYKCDSVFGFYKYLATKLLKDIILFYGPSSHGKGLVDAMSSFGVKNILRRAIITEDFYWSSAQELYDYFNPSIDEKKVYRLVTAGDIEDLPPQIKLPLKGCLKQHMIMFKKDGSVVRRREICDCDSCLDGNFESCDYVYKDDIEDCEDNEDVPNNCDHNEDVEEYDDDNDDDEEQNYNHLLEVIGPGNVVALYTPNDAKESFYLCYVNSIETASTNLYDAYGHFVLPGQRYMRCNYLSILSEKGKRHIQYKKLSLEVFVHPQEVLSPFVQISSDFKLSLDEKQWLDDSA